MIVEIMVFYVMIKLKMVILAFNGKEAYHVRS